MGAVSGGLRNRLKKAMGDRKAGNDVADMLSGKKVRNVQVGVPAGAVAERYGASETEGLEVWVIDETVTLTNAATAGLTSSIPAGAVIRSVQANLKTAVDGDGSGDNGLVKVGIGTASTPDKYGKTTGLTKNLKVDTIPPYAVLGTAETIRIAGTDSAGAAVTEKFVAGGLVRVFIVYMVLNSLDDA